MPHPAVIFGGVAFRTKIPTELSSRAALLQYLGLTPVELKKIWWFRSRMYTTFQIAKKSGKTREIQAPDRRLKMLQRNLADLLDQLYRPRHPVHGYVQDRSVKTNATSHLRGKFLVNLDIKGFFPAISENRVVGLLKALGVDHDVADIVARLTTVNSVLPQGAPSSPVISNMICFRMDKEFQAIAKAAHCIYTRYADDISFSSYQPPTALFDGAVPASGNFAPELLAPALRSAFANNGFEINDSKAHYADRHSRRIVTGLKINEGLNVDRRFVRNIRGAMFSIETLGLAADQKKFEDDHGGRGHIHTFLKGKITWIGTVKGRADPVYRNAAARFNALFPDDALKVQPQREEIRSRAVWVVEHWEPTSSQGSAFFLRGAGLVTAWHCVADAAEAGKDIDVYHPSKPSNVFKAKVKTYCATRDLAVMEHNIPANEFFEFDVAKNDLDVGESLTALGYPDFAPGDGLNVRPGEISAFKVRSGVQLVEVTQKLTQGMSGGPVIDADDRVAGVIHKGGPNEGRDFAIHVRALVDLLNGK